MKKLIFIPSFALLFVLGCKTGGNDALSSVTPYQMKTADLRAGEKLFREGNAQGATACFSCHGSKAEGQATAGFPRLAGQSRMYLAEQLENYRQGTRNNAVMAPIAKAMNEKEIRDVSAFIQSLVAPPVNAAGVLGKAELKRGRLLADVGDQKIGVQACNNCHGPGGRGELPSIPFLAGQSSSYLQNQLVAWKKGERKTSPNHMAYVAHLLDAKDIQILADYFYHLPGSHAQELPPEVKTSAKAK